jgi:hypothetical protein
MSKDVRYFETLVEGLIDQDYPSEAALVFEGDAAYCLLRRDGRGQGNYTALLGISQAQFTKWAWNDLGVPIGGPQMIQLSDGRLVAAVRLYAIKAQTTICWSTPRPAS